MAIFHQLFSIITRGTHTCTIATAAYRSGTHLKIKDKKGIVHHFDYTMKSGIAYKKIAGPHETTPEWVFDRQKFWEYIENQDHSSNLNMAVEFTLSLPEELSIEQQIAMCEDFIQNSFSKRGIITDSCIHNDHLNNPHLHILLPVKNLDGSDCKVDIDGKKVSVQDSFFVHKIREEQAFFINQYLQKNGFSNFVSHLPQDEPRYSEMRPWL